MAKTVWVPIEFNNSSGTGSNSFNAAKESGQVKQVIFSNQGSAICIIGIGTQNGVGKTLMPRENFTLPCFNNDSDTTTYYVRWLGAGSKSVVAFIQKTIE